MSGILKLYTQRKNELLVLFKGFYSGSENFCIAGSLSKVAVKSLEILLLLVLVICFYRGKS